MHSNKSSAHFQEPENNKIQGVLEIIYSSPLTTAAINCSGFSIRTFLFLFNRRTSGEKNPCNLSPLFLLLCFGIVLNNSTSGTCSDGEIGSFD